MERIGKIDFESMGFHGFPYHWKSGRKTKEKLVFESVDGDYRFIFFLKKGRAYVKSYGYIFPVTKKRILSPAEYEGLKQAVAEHNQLVLGWFEKWNSSEEFREYAGEFCYQLPDGSPLVEYDVVFP